ncbi:MAG: MBL fold metallo-hydrolase [Tetrasphaera sp.]
MTFEPAAPTIIRRPERIADETWLIHQVQEALGAPLRVYLNSMVIRGPEPVIIDTGTVANRAQWLEDVFGLVEPKDVRYVFISHDDVDHTGNLAQVMEQCPNATLLASWALVERFSNAFEFPLERCRWVDDGSHLDLADRRLHFVRPPLWDSPTTRGVFDPATKVYWAVDAFAAPCSTEVEESVDQLDPEAWRTGMATFARHAVAPWLSLVDGARYRDNVEGVRALGATTIASAHSPLISGAMIEPAFDLLADLPNVTVPAAPDQSVLDAIIADTAGGE